MAPLIDCVFLLLTYFLFTISLATVEGLLPSELALGDELLKLPVSCQAGGDEHTEHPDEEDAHHQ